MGEWLIEGWWRKRGRGKRGREARFIALGQAKATRQRRGTYRQRERWDALLAQTAVVEREFVLADVRITATGGRNRRCMRGRKLCLQKLAQVLEVLD
jgi:hypothetical protein